MRLKTEGTASIGAMLLAFLASQHHTVHMVIVNLRSLRHRPAPPAMRIAVLGVSALTVSVIVWSLARFGL